MKLSVIAGFYAAGILSLTACNSQSPYSLKAEADAAIINGLKVRETNKLSKSIVRVVEMVGAQVSSCTGTLIAEDIVLTAAHCVDGASRVAVVFGNRSEVLGVEAVAVLPHEDYKGESVAFGSNDLALLQLKQPAPAGYHPIELLKTSDEITDKTPLHFYGFGAKKVESVEMEDPGSNPNLDQLLQVGMARCNEDRTSCQEFSFVLSDELLRGVTHRTESLEKDFITNYEDYKFDSCIGDSGGPVFVKNKGQYYLYGVIRGGGGETPCQGFSIHIDVTKYADWISSSMEKLKKAPENQEPLKKD
jgi:secreted trypsin-like serine protease